jgi:hypothetical protein
MAPTTAWSDAVKFAADVQRAGGAVPPRLRGLLSSYDVLVAPAPAGGEGDIILDLARAGTLDLAARDKLAAPAAAAANQRDYLIGLAAGAENLLLGEWHRQMKTCANDIITSLRPRWTKHAEAIAEARDLFTPQTSPDQILAIGTPEVANAWRELSSHIKVIAQIARVATQFGPRLGWFPQIVEYNLADNHVLVDAAIFCTDGDLVGDSVAFGQPDPQGHRDSPWFRTTLKLRSIESARARYDAFAAIAFDHAHRPSSRGGRLIDGVVVENPAPPNPYRHPELAKG